EIEMRPAGTTTWINPLLNVSAPTFDPIDNSFQSFAQRLVYALRARITGENTWRDPAPGYLQITGKTTSAYVKEVRIAVPNQGAYANKTWEIRCRLKERDYVVSGEDGENEDRRTIVWESVTGVNSKEFGTEEEW